MKKIISLFQRNYDGDGLVRDEVVPGAEWVLEGEGIATKKWDGTACMVKDGKLYKRYDAKHGKIPPPEFIPAQEPDKVTGHWPGWIPVTDAPEDTWHRKAIYQQNFPLWTNYSSPLVDGTYELVGPKINGNREKLDSHLLVKHGECVLLVSKNTINCFDGIKKYLEKCNQDGYLEGIVWHHPDGRMVKIKYKDFYKG